MSHFRLTIAVAAMLVSGVAEAQRVTSNFGYRRDPFHGGLKMHAGMDMGAKTGTPVYATGDGFIRRARVAGGYGNLVEMLHGFGYETRFGHLSRILVSEGQFVRRGQMVGLVGSTGRSTAPHLHYEVRINGAPVQPAGYMQIVFNQQPDWNAVRYAAVMKTAPVQMASSRRSVASIAMARVVPGSSRRASGDLEIDYGSRTASGGSHVQQSGFTTGHASYGAR
jgi:hypothetical protein